MIISVHQPQYLPWLGYFDKIRKSDCFVILDKVQYKNREYQNRNRICTKTGWIWLTVPIISKGCSRQLIYDTRIDNSVEWRKKHWQSLKVWYGGSRFFDNYTDFFEDVYLKRHWERLADLNLYIIKYLMEKFNIKTPIKLESELKTTEKSTKRIIEICKKLNADTYLSGIGGKEYLDEKMFTTNKIKLKYQNFEHPVYSQCFSKDKNDFIANMSAIDLLFNNGEAAIDILFRGDK